MATAFWDSPSTSQTYIHGFCVRGLAVGLLGSIYKHARMGMKWWSCPIYPRTYLLAEVQVVDEPLHRPGDVERRGLGEEEEALLALLLALGLLGLQHL